MEIKTAVMLAAYIVSLEVRAADTGNVGRKSNTVPYKNYPMDNGETWMCQTRTKAEACMYDHEIGPCATNGSLVQCVPCKTGYRNCLRPYSEIDYIKCYRPGLDCQPEVVKFSPVKFSIRYNVSYNNQTPEVLKVTELQDGGCQMDCVCNKTAGYIRKGDECVPHLTPCGINSTLSNDKCTGCPADTYKPMEGFQECIPLPQPSGPLSQTQSPLNSTSTRSQLTHISEIPSPVGSQLIITAKALSSSQIVIQWHRSVPLPIIEYIYTVFLQTQYDQRNVSVTGDDEVMDKLMTDLQPSTIYTAYVIGTDRHGGIVKSRKVRVATKKRDPGGETDETVNVGVVAGAIVAVIVVIILILVVVVLVIICRRKKGKDTVIIEEYHIHKPSDAPPPYSCRNPGSSVSPSPYTATSRNGFLNNPSSDQASLAFADHPELISEASSQHPTSERSVCGPDTTTVKVPEPTNQSDEHEVRANQPLMDKPLSSCTSQTQRKIPFPRMGSGAECQALLNGSVKDDPDSQFGPPAMKGTN